MLDIKFIRENFDQVKESIRQRGLSLSLERLLEVAERRSELLHQVEQLRHQRKEIARSTTNPNVQANVQVGKTLKEKLMATEATLSATEDDYYQLLKQVPNILHPEVPTGTPATNQLIRAWGEVTTIPFPKDHVALGTQLDLFDFEAGARVSGTKFYYLKNHAVVLDMALTRLALDIIQNHNYTLYATPDVALQEIAKGLGYSPRGKESNSYLLEETNLCLVATSEITLGGLYANTIIKKEELPLRLGGFSHCFRKEVGAAGQVGKGLYRVHQFSKVEMFVICEPSDAEAVLEEIVAIEEQIFQVLEVPYQVFNMSSADLGAQHYRKYDIEAWMPGRNKWGEVTSASNCTDYQSRRLHIRYRDEKGTAYPYMLNGTAIATSRAMIALLENHQHPDGSVQIPEGLRPYTGFSAITPVSAAN